jgi:hypothetical protein
LRKRGSAAVKGNCPPETEIRISGSGRSGTDALLWAFRACVTAIKAEMMNQEDLIIAVERLLSERLLEVQVTSWSGLFGAVRKTIHKIRKGLGGKPDLHPNMPSQADLLARMRSLPEGVQDLLRRYYVFLEAEKSICASMNMRPAMFRRLRREASDYVLKRRERKPDFEPGRQARKSGS